jgi:DMSO/TMAO reductase YedYZ heme-binding membrane subunit
MILWEIARATGLIAVVVYTLTAAWGILLAGRGIQQPKGALELHRSLQSIGLIAIVAHVVALLLDSHANVAWTDVLGIDTRPGLVLGAVALWLAIALPITFMARQRKRISFRSWRYVHYLAYAFWGAAVAHGLWLGTDTRNPLVLAGYGAAIALVVGATAWRLSGGAPARSARRPAGTA